MKIKKKYNQISERLKDKELFEYILKYFGVDKKEESTITIIVNLSNNTKVKLKGNNYRELLGGLKIAENIITKQL